MPFDLEKMSGTWRRVEFSDNYKGAIMKIRGMPPEIVDKMQEFDVEVKVSGAGDTFTLTFSRMGRTITATHTLGVGGEEMDFDGTMKKVIYYMEGDALVADFRKVEGGPVYRQIRRFIDDDTMRMDVEVGDLKGWTVAKKIKPPQ